jgi:hypothetical protein
MTKKKATSVFVVIHDDNSRNCYPTFDEAMSDSEEGDKILEVSQMWEVEQPELEAAHVPLTEIGDSV